jgi:hypothetical protein
MLTIIALVAGLFFAPILAMLMAALYAGFAISDLVEGGPFVALVGWYVAPHVQLRVGDAMKALLRSNHEAP